RRQGGRQRRRRAGGHGGDVLGQQGSDAESARAEAGQGEQARRQFTCHGQTVGGGGANRDTAPGLSGRGDAFRQQRQPGAERLQVSVRRTTVYLCRRLAPIVGGAEQQAIRRGHGVSA